MAAFVPLLFLFSVGCCFAIFAGINIRDASIDTALASCLTDAAWSV